MHWAIWDAMFKAQNAFEGVISNYPNRALAWLLKRTVFPLGRPYVVPSDELGSEVANLLIEPSATRDRLTSGMYLPRDEADPVGALELALEATVQAEPVESKIRAACTAGAIAGNTAGELVQAARNTNIIGSVELALLARRDELRDKVIRVDDFPPDFGVSCSALPITEPRKRVAA